MSGWRLAHARVDATSSARRALARAADPWSAGALVVRAAQLASPAERRKVSAGLIALLDLAAFERRELVVSHGTTRAGARAPGIVPRTRRASRPARAHRCRR